MKVQLSPARIKQFRNLRKLLVKKDPDRALLYASRCFFTAEETVEYKRLDTEIEKLDGEILAAEEDMERRRKVAERELAERAKAPAVHKTKPEDL